MLRGNVKTTWKSSYLLRKAVFEDGTVFVPQHNGLGTSRVMLFFHVNMEISTNVPK